MESIQGLFFVQFDGTQSAIQSAKLRRCASIMAAAEAGGATLNGFIMAAVDAALSVEQIAIEQGGQGLQLDAEHLAKAQSAAEADGCTLPEWLARAVVDQAERDKRLREIQRDLQRIKSR